jgi:hypothetical protein
MFFESPYNLITDLVRSIRDKSGYSPTVTFVFTSGITVGEAMSTQSGAVPIASVVERLNRDPQDLFNEITPKAAVEPKFGFGDSALEVKALIELASEVSKAPRPGESPEKRCS